MDDERCESDQHVMLVLNANAGKHLQANVRFDEGSCTTSGRRNMQLRSSTASTAGRATAAAKGRCPKVACKAVEAHRTGSAKDMGFTNQLEALKMM